MCVRYAYRALCNGLESDQRERDREQAERAKVRRLEGEHDDAALCALYAQRERVNAWKRQPREQRERLLLDVLGDELVTIGELTQRMRDQLPLLVQSEVAYLVKCLFTSGQLDRVPEQFRGRVRYRYFRKHKLDGPIAELERAFHDDSETVA
jgi:hypothetical protein